uniref:Uncharacterized protein n=1 Tax=Calidris pygmaea TaxID=425635 RepID=A0A8C3JJH3_9CHAR
MVVKGFFEGAGVQDFALKHIVVDEAQNFRHGGLWFEWAWNLVESESGICWVFMDFFQSAHLHGCGLNFSKLYPQEWLTEVVRNAKQIHDVMSDLIEKILQKKKKHKMETSEMVEYVTTQCTSYIQQGGPVEGTATLRSTQCAAQECCQILERDLRRDPMKYRGGLVFRSAENVLGNVIVLDSISHFSGLERRIVFCIHPVPAEKKLSSLQLSLCAASGACAKLHLLFYKDDKFFKRQVFSQEFTLT